MLFFILAVTSALFGFTTFEGGTEPTAAALARLLAVVFGIAFMVAAAALAVRRAAERRDLGSEAIASRAPRLGNSLSASERGSWDGSRRHRLASPRRDKRT